MGDIRSLVSRIENVVSEDEAKSREKDAARMLSGEFDLYDFLEQIRMIKRMGSLNEIIEMMPFANALPEGFKVDDNELVRIEAMIQSMTPAERKNPYIIAQQVTRQRRIARGSGRKPDEVVDLVQRFDVMKRIMGSLTQNTGGFLSQLPGFKQLNQLRKVKNLDMGGLFNNLPPNMRPPGGMPGMGGFPGMPGMGGFPGMPGMGGFPGMPGMGGGVPQLPKGFNLPGGHRKQGDESTKAKIDEDKERRKRQAARLNRKKNR
jgi:signal recognition particle subunit SRP54